MYFDTDGGIRSGEYRDTINLWDPVAKDFVLHDALVSGLDSSGHAAGLISTEYVRNKCWKHL